MAETGEWPLIVLTTSIAVLGAFAGYAGGGGLANSTYSNFVRDKGWGMGSQVGAIPSAVGGTQHHAQPRRQGVCVDHERNLRRWRGWWRYILTDQLRRLGAGLLHGHGAAGPDVDAVRPALDGHSLSKPTWRKR